MFKVISEYNSSMLTDPNRTFDRWCFVWYIDWYFPLVTPLTISILISFHINWTIGNLGQYRLSTSLAICFADANIIHPWNLVNFSVLWFSPIWISWWLSLSTQLFYAYKSGSKEIVPTIAPAWLIEVKSIICIQHTCWLLHLVSQSSTCTHILSNNYRASWCKCWLQNASARRL